VVPVGLVVVQVGLVHQAQVLQVMALEVVVVEITKVAVVVVQEKLPFHTVHLLWLLELPQVVGKK
jgi:hypothetical protein